MSVNKEFGEMMDKEVKALVKNGEYNKSTNHVTFSAEKIELPKGVTTESLGEHVKFINNLSAQVEVATGQFGLDQFEHNKELTTIDGTLNMGDFTINSQFHLKQQVGEDFIFGQHTTAIDYAYSEEQTEYLQTQRASSHELAAKLFE